MEPKTSLNNTQRKMLDTIFTERIDKKIRSYKEKRQTERNKLVKSELEKAKKNKDVKEFEKLYKQTKTLQESLLAKGIKVGTNYGGVVEVSLNTGSYDGTAPLPVEAFELETAKLDEKIHEAKTEIRARIYGMDTSYEEVDKELKEYFSFLDK